MDPNHELFKKYCRVYWGSHGCKLERGHPGNDHVCSCCECTNHPEQDSEGTWCSGAPPYYGVFDQETLFYGEDWDGSIPLPLTGGNPEEDSNEDVVH